MSTYQQKSYKQPNQIQKYSITITMNNLSKVYRFAKVLQLQVQTVYLQLLFNLSFISTLIMKIIQQIKALASRVGKKLLDFVIPSLKRHQAIKKSEEHSIKNKQRKTLTKRIFACHQESNFFRNSSYLPKRLRKIRKFPLIGKLINYDAAESFQDLNSQKSDLKRGKKNTNELTGVATGMQIQDGHLFMDNNGLQISEIESIRDKNDPLNYSAQSDRQILKFILGDQPKIKPKNLRNQKQEVNQVNRIPRKDWWLQVVQASDSSVSSNSKKDSLLAESLRQAQGNSNNYSYSKLKIKKTRSQPKKATFQRSKIKVIQMIDLVADEERPKLFHIPLVRNLKI